MVGILPSWGPVTALANVDLAERPCLLPRTFCGPLYELSAGALSRGPYPACRKNMGNKGKRTTAERHTER